MSSIKDLDHLSQAELAMLWGVSTRTIQRLPELPSLRHGEGQRAYYVWAEFLAYQKRVMSQGGPDGNSHKDRLDKVKADDAEWDFALKRGSLMQASKAQEQWANECAAMRGRLLSIPAIAALKIDPSHTQGQREEIIRKDIYEALENLSGAVHD